MSLNVHFNFKKIFFFWWRSKFLWLQNFQENTPNYARNFQVDRSFIMRYNENTFYRKCNDGYYESFTHLPSICCFIPLTVIFSILRAASGNSNGSSLIAFLQFALKMLHCWFMQSKQYKCGSNDCFLVRINEPKLTLISFVWTQMQRL